MIELPDFDSLLSLQLMKFRFPKQENIDFMIA